MAHVHTACTRARHLPDPYSATYYTHVIQVQHPIFTHDNVGTHRQRGSCIRYCTKSHTGRTVAVEVAYTTYKYKYNDLRWPNPVSVWPRSGFLFKHRQISRKAPALALSRPYHVSRRKRSSTRLVGGVGRWEIVGPMLGEVLRS